MIRQICMLLALLCFGGTSESRAQDGMPPVLGGQVKVNYEQPSKKYIEIYEGLKRRKVLERLQRFLSPLRLPRDLTVRLAECGADTKTYSPGGPVTLCYEMVEKIVNITMQNTKDANEQTLVIDGSFVQAVLHEVSYAIFDLLQVPIWGREHDAADRLAALIMIQFGDQVALTTIVGTAKFFEYSKRAWTGEDFAEVGSPEAQRFYNLLCIAYGGDPLTFSFLAPRPQPGRRLPMLSERRARQCGREYEQVRHAFDLRIMPYVDPDLVIKVRASQWLEADETVKDIR
jgi:Putative metallopeptidase